MKEIKQLWPLLPHIQTPDGPTTIRWFARNLEGTEKAGGYADTEKELIAAIHSCPDRNFYVCPNPTLSRVGIRNRTSDVTHWSWLLLDIDPIVKSGFDPHPLMDAALLYLGDMIGEDFARTSPIVIDSGRGLQAWFRLNDWPLADKSEGPYGSNFLGRREARITMRYWLDKLDKYLGEVSGCRIDTTTSDLPRPMRCPGTKNAKTHRMTRMIIPSSHIFMGLAHRLIVGVPSERFRVDPIPSLPGGVEWQDVFVNLTIKAQNYLCHGKVEPGRHETAWHTAKNLAEKGLTREAVRRALVYANSLRGKDAELSEMDIEHALDTAFRQLTAEGR